MIVGIIIAVIIIASFGFAIFKANKKIKGIKNKEQDALDKEFEDGKVLLPIDKRDFQDFDEFKNNSSNIKEIKNKLDNIDKDFDKFELKKEDGK